MYSISDKAKHLCQLAKQAEDLRAQINKKASEIGYLTQELFIIEQSSQALLKTLQTQEVVYAKV